MRVRFLLATDAGNRYRALGGVAKLMATTGTYGLLIDESIRSARKTPTQRICPACCAVVLAAGLALLATACSLAASADAGDASGPVSPTGQDSVEQRQPGEPEAATPARDSENESVGDRSTLGPAKQEPAVGRAGRDEDGNLGAAAAQVAVEDHAHPCQAIRDMHWVLVEDPGNKPDTNSLGAVGRSYNLGRYEVTNEEYCAFLNSSEVGRQNLHGVADGPSCLEVKSRPADHDRGIVRTAADGGGFTYKVVLKMGDKPVVNLGWSDAARYANWLHNGGCVGADTETGAYDLSGMGVVERDPTPRSPDAIVWIPTLNEWYKAAFSKVKDRKCLGYWTYATGSDEKPKAVAADEFGIGQPPAGGDRGGNYANITRMSRWPSAAQGVIKKIEWKSVGAVTSVGTNGRASDWGGYDMVGNVAEIVEIHSAPNKLGVLIVGGDFTTPHDRFESADVPVNGGDAQAPRGGFRLACRPHPSISLTAPVACVHLEQIDECLAVTKLALNSLIQPVPAHIAPGALQHKICTLDKLLKSSTHPPVVKKLVDETKNLLVLVEVAATNRDREKKRVKDLLDGILPFVNKTLRRTLIAATEIDLRNIEQDFETMVTGHQTNANCLRDECESIGRRLMESTFAIRRELAN